jgi:hypothetical protein
LIYEYAFSGRRIAPVLKPKHPIGLLLTCRQLHTEAALLVYQHFTFAFDMISPATVNHRTGGGPFDDVRKIPRTLLHFLRLRTTAQRLAIQHLELVTWIAREMWMQISAPFTPQHFLFLDQMSEHQDFAHFYDSRRARSVAHPRSGPRGSGGVDTSQVCDLRIDVPGS